MEVVWTKVRESKPTLTTEIDYTIVKKDAVCLDFENGNTPRSEHRDRKRVVREGRIVFATRTIRPTVISIVRIGDLDSPFILLCWGRADRLSKIALRPRRELALNNRVNVTIGKADEREARIVTGQGKLERLLTVS